jgi:hypothetical protein
MSQQQPQGASEADLAIDVVPDGGENILSANADTPITPELKQAIAEEVHQQVAYENAAATQPERATDLSGLPQTMVQKHLFLVSEAMDVVTPNNAVCSLGAGNVLRLEELPTDTAPLATLTVVASRREECPAGALVTLSLDQLQEMDNNFRAQIDNGLQILHEKQGQGGLPSAPAPALATPPRPADNLPPDNPDVAGMLAAQQTQAERVETMASQMAADESATSQPQATTRF